MTEGLLAVYPDVFKGGSEFAGVPAGCWAVGDPDGQWSSQCADGQVTHTAQEWGDLVRAMYPSYMGHRPRVQLFHGDADATIDYENHTEAIKEWTNVLGLGTEPTTTETVTLGSHQATRRQWKNACGYVVLDAFQSKGGDHGPSDALFNASFVVPFLALDNTEATDPEVAMCDSGGAGGMGGSSGGTPASGGATLGGAAGAGGPGGRSGGPGGIGALGGMTGIGGASALGGMPSGGGNSATGGTPGTGGIPSTSGSGATSVSGAGGALPATGGSSTSTAGGGSTGRVASAGAGAGETSGDSSSPDRSGCGCTVGGSATASVRGIVLALVGVLALGRRRRREGDEAPPGGQGSSGG
jgi:MYXO-CTERM domain-containing protein